MGRSDLDSIPKQSPVPRCSARRLLPGTSDGRSWSAVSSQSQWPRYTQPVIAIVADLGFSFSVRYHSALISLQSLLSSLRPHYWWNVGVTPSCHSRKQAAI